MKTKNPARLLLGRKFRKQSLLVSPCLSPMNLQIKFSVTCRLGNRLINTASTYWRKWASFYVPPGKLNALASLISTLVGEARVTLIFV